MWVEIEGISGAGKTTFTNELRKLYPEAKYVKQIDPDNWAAVYLSQKPTSAGMMLAIILSGYSFRARSKGELVFQDRGIISEMAYLPNARRGINRILDGACRLLEPKADLYILIDTPGEVARERIENRDGREELLGDYIAETETLIERRELYLKLFQKVRKPQLLLSGEKAPGETAGKAAEIIEQLR